MTGSTEDNNFRRPITWHCGAETDKGTVRKNNEDALLTRSELGFWAVADGMGGHSVGDVASRMIVEALEEVHEQGSLADIVDAVEQSIVNANASILEYAKVKLGSATMGSTVVALIIYGRVGVALWAGDSRLYRLRGRQLSLLTRDHSHVQELVDAGHISAEEAKNHPHGNVITRAIGVDPDGYVDLAVFNTQVGDTFLLCSDGLYNAIEEPQFAEVMARNTPENAAKQLISASLAAGASDNVTVVVVKGEDSKNRSSELADD